MIIKHVAKKGKQAGKFVACTAKIKCRNGGVHITPVTYKQVKAAYGEVTLDSYSKALNDGVVVSTVPAPTQPAVKPVAIPVFETGTTQEEFNKFLKDNGVRAEYEVRSFTADHKLEPTGEVEDLYRVGGLSYFEKALKGATSFTSPASAEKSSLATIIAMKRDPGNYSVSDANVRNIARIAGTPNLTPVTKTRFKEMCDILEDYNYHTFDAYVTALYNKTNG